MKKIFLIYLCVILIFLSGCWDQSLLVNKTLINGVSFDITDKNELLGSARILNIESKGGGQFDLKDELIETKSKYSSEVGPEINFKMPGKIDVSKAHIILIGEELGKQGIHPFLEIFYRPKDAYVTARVVMTKGSASDILSVNPQKSPIAFEILKALKSSESLTNIPKETVFSTWSQVVDSREDLLLPFVEKVENDRVAIGGVYLFHKDKYTGYSIPKEKSTLLLLLSNGIQKEGLVAVNLKRNRSTALRVMDEKRKMDLVIDKANRKIKCKINLELDVNLVSYSNNLEEKTNVNSLNKDISTLLTKEAKELTSILLEANCDALGIGRKLASSHPDIWKKLDWEKDYKNVQFETKVKVNITKTGAVF
ncbi:Ger(x)C family spore germination protein [Gottfriedia solisilvae]|uniref:Germination protein n=1 Tax=Gottfriedia solisilvae TaxID=1516104 RepID=A0A8J3ATK8_9BACI|nr:Ger(x)C family spore germination protein [Gottfriedia solisilvae]GGI15903.1 germination protein [Gottfriedia solisilvae]